MFLSSARRSVLWPCSKLLRSSLPFQSTTEKLQDRQDTSPSSAPSSFSPHLPVHKRPLLFPPHLLGLCLMVSIPLQLVSHQHKHGSHYPNTICTYSLHVNIRCKRVKFMICCRQYLLKDLKEDTLCTFLKACFHI